MKRDTDLTAAPGRQPRADGNFGESLRAEFPHLDIVHQIEIRGSCHWDTLAESSLCLLRFGAEPVSVSANRYDERAQAITYRIRLLEEKALGEAVVELKRLRGVKSIMVSHHLGRASGIGGGTRRPGGSGHSNLSRS